MTSLGCSRKSAITWNNEPMSTFTAFLLFMAALIAALAETTADNLPHATVDGDLEVCADGRNRCTDSNSTCVPTDVGYRCECASGYQKRIDDTSASGWRCSRINHRCGFDESPKRGNDSSGSGCRHRRQAKGTRAQSPNVPGPSGHGQAAPRFEDPPIQVADSRRLWAVRKAGHASDEETFAKPCSVPYNGMKNIGACVSNACVLQAVAKALTNSGCWQAEIEQCAGNTHVPCSSPGVLRVHDMLTKPNGLAAFMAAQNLKPGEFQSELDVIGDLLILLSRNPDGSRSPLGYKFSLKSRHVVQGDDQLFTWMPFQMVMREGSKGTDFSQGNELLDAVFAGAEDRYFPTDRLSDRFLSYLTKKPGQSEDYYKNKKITLHAHVHGYGQQAHRVPRHVTRLLFRFDWLVFGNKLRTVPQQLESNGRVFLLHTTIAVTEDAAHLYTFSLKWKSRSLYECWVMDSLKEPELLTGDAKKRCTHERIMWPIFVARGADLAP